MPIERLTAVDQLMRRWDDRWPQDIGALVVLDGSKLLDGTGRFRLDAVRKVIESRLHLVPRFRQIIHVPPRGLGGPLWIDAPDFDLNEHVHVLPPPLPTDEADLLLVTERLRRQRLIPSRPLWEMWFIPGLADRRVALFVKLNHALADGMAAMAAVGVFLDPDPDSPVDRAPPWTPEPAPTRSALLADQLRRRAEVLGGELSALTRPLASLRKAGAAWPMIRALLLGKPPRSSSLDRWVGPDRRLLLIRSRVDRFKEIAHANEATLNDVLLAVTAGGLRALLKSRGETVEGFNAPVYVPISLRHEGGSVQGNVLAQMVVPLPLGEPSPPARLRWIAREAAKRKQSSRVNMGTFFHSELATRLMVKAVGRQRVNVTTANLHGPEWPLYFAGARMLEAFPVLPLIANEALGIGALSYAGAFNLCVIGDRDAYPDLDVLAAGMRAELDALGSSLRARTVAPLPPPPVRATPRHSEVSP